MKNFFLMLLVLYGCNNVNHKKDIDELLRSKNIADIIEANYLIGESKDTSFVKLLFDNIEDPRITHDVRFKGISVYQSKIIALKKIFNVLPPKKISYSPDTLIINFYKNLALKNNIHFNK